MDYSGKQFNTTPLKLRKILISHICVLLMKFVCFISIFIPKLSSWTRKVYFLLFFATFFMHYLEGNLFGVHEFPHWFMHSDNTFVLVIQTLMFLIFLLLLRLIYAFNSHLMSKTLSLFFFFTCLCLFLNIKPLLNICL